MIWLPSGEETITICLAGLIEYRNVTDGQTDRQNCYISVSCVSVVRRDNETFDVQVGGGGHPSSGVAGVARVVTFRETAGGRDRPRHVAVLTITYPQVHPARLTTSTRPRIIALLVLCTRRARLTQMTKPKFSTTATLRKVSSNDCDNDGQPEITIWPPKPEIFIGPYH